MPSIQSKFLNIILKHSNIKSSFDRAFDSGKFGKGNICEPPEKLYSCLNIEKMQSEGRNVFILKPKNKPTKTHILYLHGGGYIYNFNKIHWRFLNTLVQTLNCTIIAPDYPLAPNYTYKDSFEMLIPIYKKLIDEVGEKNLILMGDSSGGGFALALAQKMKKENNNTANQIILLSPWLDISLKNKDISSIDSKDPILSISGLKRAGKAYSGSSSPDNYLLSPINGEIEGLGKISIFIGTNDILEADARKFKTIAQERNISINYFEYKDMFHVWPFFNLPESKKALGQIINLIFEINQKN
ncbi:MAG: alpha/beta hydrolase fold domain-containing protein [Clostridiaceae bacterium]